MALRLPDIPFQFWADDQQERLRKEAQAQEDALTFRVATIDQNSQIPDPSFNQMMADQEQQRLLEEQQRQEQLAAQERERQQQEQMAQAEQQRRDSEAIAQVNQERERAQQADGIASSLGIKLPGEIGNYFSSLVGTKPGTGQNDTTTGAFTPGASGSMGPEPVDSSSFGADPYAPQPETESGSSSIPGITTPDQFAQSVGAPASPAAAGGYEAAGAPAPEMYGPSQQETVKPIWQQAYDFGAKVAAPTIEQGGLVYEKWKRQWERDDPQYNEATRAGQQEYGVSPRDMARPTEEAIAALPVEQQDQVRARDNQVGRMLADPRYGPGIKAEQDANQKAIDEYVSVASAAPWKIIQDTANVLASPLGLDRESKDISAGYGEKFGVGKIGLTDVASNLAPGKWLQVAQWMPLAGQMLQDPENTATGMAVILTAAELFKANPKAATAFVGGVVGAIDSYMNERDFNQSGAWDVGDLALEAGAAGIGTSAVVYGGKPAAKLTGQSIVAALKGIADSPNTTTAARALDRITERVVDEIKQFGQSAYGLAREYPEAAAGVGAAAAAKALGAGDGDSGVPGPAAAGLGVAGTVAAGRRSEGAQAVGRLVGEAAQDVAPKMADLFQPAMRMFHGTDRAYGKIDVKKFDKDALYGPGLYLTDNSDIAAEYSSRSRLGGLIPDHEIRAERAVRELTDAEAKLERFKNNPEDRDFWQAKVDEARAAVEQTSTQGPNVRAVELPSSLKMFDTRREYTPEEADWVVDNFRKLTGETLRLPKYREGEDLLASVMNEFADDPTIPGAKRMASTPVKTITGGDIYNAMDIRLGDRQKVNQFLASVGYDGLFHEGGNIRGSRDAAGNLIKHEVAVIFPDSVEKTRNAFSKEFGHAAVPAGLGAGAGGAEGDKNTTPQDRAGMAAMGAMLAVGAARKIPRSGVWRERLSKTFHIPDNLGEQARTHLTNAFEQAAEAVEESMVAKGAKRTMYWRRQADAAWDKFTALREALGISDTVGEATTSGVERAGTEAVSSGTDRLPSGLAGGVQGTGRPVPSRAVQGEAATTARNLDVGTGTSRSAEQLVVPETVPSARDRGNVPQAEAGAAYDNNQSLARSARTPSPRPGEAVEASGAAGVGSVADRVAASDAELDTLSAELTYRYGGVMAARLLDGESVDVTEGITLLDKAKVRDALGRADAARRGLPDPPSLVEEMQRPKPASVDMATLAEQRRAEARSRPVEEPVLDDLEDEMIPPERIADLEFHPTDKNDRPSWKKGDRLGQSTLDKLENEGWEVQEARDAFDEYASLERSDFERGADGAEEYADEKQSLWETFYQTLQDVTRPKQAADAAQSRQNLNSFAGGAAGAVGGGLTDEQDDDDSQHTIENMATGLVAGSILGRKTKIAPAFANDKALRNNPINRMMADPSSPVKIVNKGIFERAAEFWKTKMTDDTAVLQGWMNDLAKEFRKQTGKLLPASTLAAEVKRFDPMNAIKQEADIRMKPSLQYFARISEGENAIPEGDIEAYFAAMHNVDIAAAQANPNRTFPGKPVATVQKGASLADSQDSVAKFEQNFINTHGAEAWKEFQSHAQKVWDYSGFLLDVAEGAGLINAKTSQELRKTYPHWMPTRIVSYLEKSSDAGGIGSGKSLSVGSNNIHELSYGGTGEEAMTPLAALLSESYRVFASAQKNQVFNGVHEMIQLSHGKVAGFDPAGKIIAQQNTNTAQSVIRQTSAETRRLARYNDQTIIQLRPSQATPDGYVPLEGYVDGVKVKYALHEDLGDVVKFAKPTVIPIMSGLMSAFRAGATARNPVFLTANAGLDFSSYLQRELSRSGGPTPMNIGKVLYAYGQVAGEFLPLSTAAGAGLGAWAGARQIDEDDSLWEQAGKVVGGMAAGGTAGYAARGRDRQVISDIAKNEYRGRMRDYLLEGGGTAGGYFTPNRRPLEDVNVFGNGLDARIQQVLSSFGLDRASEAQNEVRELQRRGLTGMRPGGMLELRNWGEAARVLKDIALLKPVEALGQRIELVPRVAARQLARNRAQGGVDVLAKELTAAKAAVAAGGTPSRPIAVIAEELDDMTRRQTIEGVQAGRTTTLDFNKGGTWARNINQLIPFFNVGVQSTADLQRAIAANPGAYTSSLALTVMAPLVAAEVNNNWDAETQKDYADVPQYIKDQGIVVMLPKSIFKPSVDAQGNEHPQFLHYRLRNLAPLAIATREFLNNTLYKNGAAKDQPRDPMEVAMAMGSALMPMSATSQEDFTQSFVPLGISTIQQLQDNKDKFRGARIVSAEADDRASPLSHGLANLTGVGRPSQWEFGTRDIGTGYAKMLHGASALFGDEPVSSAQGTPLAGGLYGQWVKGSIGGEAQYEQEHTTSQDNEAALKKAGVYWRPAPADPEINGVPLDRSELAEYQKLLNENVNRTITQVVNSPSWQQASKADKKAILEHYVNETRALVRDRFADRIPDGLKRRRLTNEYNKGRISTEDARRKVEALK